jgi:hypothetical protein
MALDDGGGSHDRAFGVPQVYRRIRAGAMSGAGYTGAGDRLLYMDVLRHAGRRELSSFAGGANQAQDAGHSAVAPYTDADLDKHAADLLRHFNPQILMEGDRPVLLRRRPPAPIGGAALGRVDQPADVPAGRRDPATRRALTTRGRGKVRPFEFGNARRAGPNT